MLCLLLVGYTNSDVIYKWKNPQKAVEIADDMKLSQFDLVDCPAGNMTDKIGHNKDGQDMLIPVPYVCKYIIAYCPFRPVNGYFFVLHFTNHPMFCLGNVRGCPLRVISSFRNAKGGTIAIYHFCN